MMKTDMEKSCTKHSIVPGELVLVKILHYIQKPDMSDLIRETGMSKTTVHRKLRELREIYHMVITFHRSSGERGGKGHYRIEDWGIINKEAFKQKITA